MPQNSAIELILVPQGAEQQAVQRGFGAVEALSKFGGYPAVLPIPMGPQTVSAHLEALQSMGQLSVKPGCNVLLMGLGGSLSSEYHMGDVVLVREISFVGNQGMISSALAHRPLIQTLYSGLKQGIGNRHSYRIGIEKGITCDRIITETSEKQTLSQAHGASVVDMEGEPVIRFFQSLGANVAVLRVISDNHDTSLPDLNKAIDANGNLHPRLMAWQCLKKPCSAIRLIQGGLVGLAQLSTITRYCLTPTPSSE